MPDYLFGLADFVRRERMGVQENDKGCPQLLRAGDERQGQYRVAGEQDGRVHVGVG